MIWLVMPCLMSKEELGQFPKYSPEWGHRNLFKIQILIAKNVANSQV